jgi:excisionase family DNA binding protein
VADLTTIPKTDLVDEVITARVAAREKGVHPASVYRAVKEGRLKGSRSGHTILIHRRDLAGWVPIGHRPRAGTTSLPQALDPASAEEEARRIQREKNEPLIQLLRFWSEEGNEEEQRNAFENLKRTFEEDPWTTRKLFP